MVKRPVAASDGLGRPNPGHQRAEPRQEPTAAERLRNLASHCEAAKALADDLDQRFLAHLLAMVLLEARSLLDATGTRGKGRR